MNARQKAKKLKKELNFYKNMPIPTVKTYDTNVKTYRVSQTVDTGYLHEMSTDSESPQTYIYRMLVDKLAKAMINDVEFKLEPSIIPYHTDITAEITIATRR